MKFHHFRSSPLEGALWLLLLLPCSYATSNLNKSLVCFKNASIFTHHILDGNFYTVDISPSFPVVFAESSLTKPDVPFESLWPCTYLYNRVPLGVVCSLVLNFFFPQVCGAGTTEGYLTRESEHIDFATAYVEHHIMPLMFSIQCFIHFIGHTEV